MKNVGRIQVALPRGERERATSVVVTTPFASVAAGVRRRRTVETSGASASVPSRDSEGGERAA